MMELDLEYKASFSEDKTAPLVYFVHGRAGNKEVMWTFHRSVPPGSTIIAPQAPRPDPLGGFSWWDVLAYDDITEAMIDEGVVRLENFMTESIRRFELKPRKILAFGFSQGSGAVSLIMQRNPRRFCGVALLAGFVIKDWRPHPPEPLPPVFIAHGTKDTMVPLSRAENGKVFLEAHGSKVTMVTDEVTHKVGSDGMRGLQQWTKDLLKDSSEYPR